MDHLIDDEEMPRHERELTLSTGAILGIFLALAVLCGAFFGFGYNMGRKSAPTPLVLGPNDLNANADVASGTAPAAVAKPSADEAASAPATPVPAPKPTRRTVVPQPAKPVAEGETAESAAKPSPSVRTPTPTAATSAPTAAPIVRQPAPVSPAALSSTATPAAAGGGSYMVQVAAVSHKEDADLLLGALRGRGYAVSARSGAGDSFIHVQVGPFRDKKEADAMRQRLLTDGYNAIVKQ